MAKAKQAGKLVMVADDDEDLAFLLAAQLRQLGYRVSQCLNGENLVEEVQRQQPFLLLLDIAMQMNDGSQLCRELKANPQTKQVKILLMSGNHNVAEHAKACGADGYVAKPLSLSIIKSALSKYE